MTALTHDTISLRGSGILAISQPRPGVRFTLDSILLADFCRIRTRDRIFEPGAGTGIISLLLANKFPATRLVADEIEPNAFALLCHNIESNGLIGRITPINQDIRSLDKPVRHESFDVIVANPPYTVFGKGRSSPSRERQQARHDQISPLGTWLDLQKLLKNMGRYVLIFPALRLADLMGALKERKLEPKRLRFVHARPDRPASLVLVEAVKKGGTGLDILPPLFIHNTDGGRSQEMTDIYGLSVKE